MCVLCETFIVETGLTGARSPRPSRSPAEFRSYFEYCRSLRFEDRPDYAYLKVRRARKNTALVAMSY